MTASSTRSAGAWAQRTAQPRLRWTTCGSASAFAYFGFLLLGGYIVGLDSKTHYPPTTYSQHVYRVHQRSPLWLFYDLSVSESTCPVLRWFEMLSLAFELTALINPHASLTMSLWGTPSLPTPTPATVASLLPWSCQLATRSLGRVAFGGVIEGSWWHFVEIIVAGWQ